LWLRGWWLVLLPVVVVAVTVFPTSSIQKSAEQRAFDRVQHSQQLLAAWLDRTNALRGFLQTGTSSAFGAFSRSAVTFQAAVQTERTDARSVAQARAIVASEMQFAQRWQTLGLIAAATIRQHGVRPLPIAMTMPRTNASAAFQAAVERYTLVMEGRRKSDIATASELGDGIVVLAVLILAIAALAMMRASRGQDRRRMEARLVEEQDRAASERSYVEGRRRLSQMLLAAGSEDEACQLANWAIESGVAGSSVVVLRCNDSSDRLEPLTPLPEPSALAQPLRDATPRSCAAIRLGRAHVSDADASSAALCALCGQTGGCATCEPLVVGGEVIGSMLIIHPQPLSSAEQRTISDTIAYSTPVLANLRNLALAERRARTDVLTGLPNRRALDDMLKLMLAQATRTGVPLSIVLADVDQFKEANDTFGHDRGDELLSTVADAFARSVRASDLVARLGGDEFVVVLPATDLEGARNVAENMAAATVKTRLVGVDWKITASFGIASFPHDGPDIETVMQIADRALYQAKRDGRNCVRLASAIPRATAAAP
jgi:diguanylate cyclase (GGDEF)-like protein